MADEREARRTDHESMFWPVSRTTSAWLQAQRARTPEAHRAWVDEAIRQAQIAGELRAEVQAALATLNALLEVDLFDIKVDRLYALRAHLRAALERTA